MALTYREPQIVGSPNIREPRVFLIPPQELAVWRRGDIVVSQTSGTITVPPGNGTGTLTGVAGPITPAQAAASYPTLTSPVTVTQNASAGAPLITYFCQVTYALTGGNESQPSPVFIVNTPPGFLPTISVSATGAPATATSYNLYAGTVPSYLSKQNAAIVAFGTGTALTNPLTNTAGAVRGATNLAGSIYGLAVHGSQENYFDGYAGSGYAGSPSSRLGSSNSMAPLMATEAPLSYVFGLGFGQLVEFSLNTASGAYSPYLINTTAGLTLDATTGFFTVDTTQANKVCTIVDSRPGVYIGPTAQNDGTGLGARVIVEFSSSALALQ